MGIKPTICLFLILLTSFSTLAGGPSLSEDRLRLAALSLAERMHAKAESLHAALQTHLKKRADLEEQKDDLIEQEREAKAKLAKAEEELQALIAEKAQALEELRLGFYCSQCGRPKSQIEREEKTTFAQHLVDVKGKSLPATQERLDAKAEEYDQKIQALQKKISDTDERDRKRFAAKRTQLNKRIVAWNDRKNKLLNEIADAKDSFREAAAEYVRLTRVADEKYDKACQDEINEKVQASADKHAKDIARQFKSALNKIENDIKNGTVTAIDDQLKDLRQKVWDWQTNFHSEVDADSYVIVYTAYQKQRLQERLVELARPQAIGIPGPAYSYSHLGLPTIQQPDWNGYSNALAYLNDQKLKLQAVAASQKFLKGMDSLEDRLKSRTRRIRDGIASLFSSSDDSSGWYDDDVPDEVPDYAPDDDGFMDQHQESIDQVRTFLDYFRRHYPDTINILTEYVYNDPRWPTAEELDVDNY